MDLYKNKKMFVDAINNVSRIYKINKSLVEKDYFVVFILSKLNEKIPGLLFKGGTCCSHAYGVIDRFSEDIDLSLDTNHFGRKQNINANKTIIEVCDELGFIILNREEVEKHSHGNFNRYYIEYPISSTSLPIKPFVQVEMSFYTKSYPTEYKKINSLIGDWLINDGKKNVAHSFNLLPFSICVQKLERTFIDKVFAICDYYERKEFERNSRHIYDLFKISSVININEDSFKLLILDVKNDRKKNEKCYSAKDGYCINDTLKKIVQSECFKADYENVTMLLLTKPIDYQTAIQVIDLIIEKQIFLFNSF